MNLETLRKEMDGINEELIALFAKRLELAKKIAKYKGENNLPIYDEQREKLQGELIQELAKEHGLRPELTLQLFATFIEYCRKEMQKEI